MDHLLPILSPTYLNAQLISIALYTYVVKKKFCFQFNRAGTHKTLDKDLVVLLLKMCLAGGRIDPERLDTFCDFLESTVDENYSKITLDQWRSFLDFSHEHPTSESLLGYDEGESAWPVLIDEYCEYMAKKMGKEKK